MIFRLNFSEVLLQVSFRSFHYSTISSPKHGFPKMACEDPDVTTMTTQISKLRDPTVLVSPLVSGVCAGEVPASNGIFHRLPVFRRVSVPNGIDQILALSIWWKHSDMVESNLCGLQDMIKNQHSTLEKEKWRNSPCTQSFAINVNQLWLLPFEQEQSSHVM